MIPMPDLTGELERQVTKPKSHRKPNRARFASIIIRELEWRSSVVAEMLPPDTNYLAMTQDQRDTFNRYTHLLRLATSLRDEFGLPL